MIFFPLKKYPRGLSLVYVSLAGLLPSPNCIFPYLLSVCTIFSFQSHCMSAKINICCPVACLLTAAKRLDFHKYASELLMGWFTLWVWKRFCKFQAAAWRTRELCKINRTPENHWEACKTFLPQHTVALRNPGYASKWYLSRVPSIIRDFIHAPHDQFSLLPYGRGLCAICAWMFMDVHVCVCVHTL